MAKITMEDGSTIEGSVEELAEMARVFGMGEDSKADGEAEELEKESSLKVGDLAVIADSADEVFLGHGDIVRITARGDIYDFYVERLSDGEKEFFNASELTPYVPESKELRVGDKVMLVIPQGETPAGNFGDVKTGDIGSITELNPTPRRDFVANFPKQSYWTGLSSEVVVVGRAEEETEVKAEEQSKTRRFKVGDKVRVLRDNAANSVNEEGDIGVIMADDRDILPYKVTVEGRKNFGNYHDETSIELVQEGVEPGDIIATKFYGILEVYGINEYDHHEVRVRINGRDDALERSACTLVAKKSDRRDI